MFWLILTLYIVVATYYLVGIILAFEELEKNDAFLRRFMRKCGSSRWFAATFIFTIAYMWPIGWLLQPFITPWVRKTFRNQLPVKKITNAKFINTPNI